MQTNVEQGRLALARVRFAPVACMLDRLAEDIEKEHGPSAVLEQKGPMEPMAQNVCSVRYSLRHPDEDRLALTFVVTGESADRPAVASSGAIRPRGYQGQSRAG